LNLATNLELSLNGADDARWSKVWMSISSNSSCSLVAGTDGLATAGADVDE
jgi:hypothetical protein